MVATSNIVVFQITQSDCFLCLGAVLAASRSSAARSPARVSSFVCESSRDSRLHAAEPQQSHVTEAQPELTLARCT